MTCRLSTFLLYLFGNFCIGPPRHSAYTRAAKIEVDNHQTKH